MYLEIFLADFAVFRVFWGISWDFAGPRPREILEALVIIIIIIKTGSNFVSHSNCLRRELRTTQVSEKTKLCDIECFCKSQGF